jgi:hypothetical protein
MGPRLRGDDSFGFRRAGLEIPAKTGIFLPLSTRKPGFLPRNPVKWLVRKSFCPQHICFSRLIRRSPGDCQSLNGALFSYCERQNAQRRPLPSTWF